MPQRSEGTSGEVRDNGSSVRLVQVKRRLAKYIRGIKMSPTSGEVRDNAHSVRLVQVKRRLAKYVRGIKMSPTSGEVRDNGSSVTLVVRVKGLEPLRRFQHTALNYMNHFINPSLTL
jgi:hypothetical protein